MGWRRDWLYRRVFDLVEGVWRKTQKEAARIPSQDIAPDYLIVLEYTNADSDTAYCLPPISQAWTYSGGEFVSLSDTDTQQHLSVKPIRRGMYYSYGVICFHIAPDRRRVIWTQTLGSLHGRGLVYCVVGQGRRGRLEVDSQAPGWVS